MPSLKERFAELDEIQKNDPELYAQMFVKAKNSSKALNTLSSEL